MVKSDALFYSAAELCNTTALLVVSASCNASNISNVYADTDEPRNSVWGMSQING